MIKNNKTNKILKAINCLLVISLITSGPFHTPTSAGNDKVPVDLQAKLFLTVLTYDKNLEKKVNGQLSIGILYFPESSQSKKEALNFSKTLEGFKDKKISGRSFDTIELTYNDNGDLKKKIADKNINILYIAKGEKKLVEEVIKVTQSEKILSCASRATYVTAYGVSMTVGLKKNKPKIYLNLSSAKAEGTDFSAKFLRIVEIVSKDNR